MATEETYISNQLYLVNLLELAPDPGQPRKYFDPQALDELTASIVRNNVLSPIHFRVENGIKYIVTGERRCLAAQKAGLAAIPAIYLDNPDHAEISLIENIIRADLTPVEEAEALDRLMQDHQYQQDDLARIFGKSKSLVSDTLSLTKLPQEIRDECRKDPSIPKHVLITIARNKQQRSMLSKYRKYKAQQTTAAKRKPRTGGKRTQTESTITALSKADSRISMLDIPSLSPEDRAALVQACEALKQTIEELLAAAVASAP